MRVGTPVRLDSGAKSCIVKVKVNQRTILARAGAVNRAPRKIADSTMKIHLETAAGLNVVRQYGPGRVTVNAADYRASLIVLPDRLVNDWPPQLFADLSREHFEIVAALKPELVVFGTGARLRFPAPSLTVPLIEAGIGLEVMDTAAACRTYNILVSEGRNVAGVLLMIEED